MAELVNQLSSTSVISNKNYLPINVSLRCSNSGLGSLLVNKLPTCSEVDPLLHNLIL